MKSGALYCNAVAMRGLPEFIRQRGGTPERIFARAGLNMAHIKSNNYYEWDKLCNLLTLAADMLDEPQLGIKFAYDVPKDFLNSGPMLILAAMLPTMRDFFDFSSLYQKLHVNGFAYDYFENRETHEVECEIQIHPLSPPCRQLTEHVMASMFIMLGHYLGGWKLKRLSFQHTAPADLSWHEKTFQCPIEFSADKTMAYMDLGFLDIELGGRLQKLQPIVKSYLNRKITKTPRFNTTIAQTVERLLPTILGLRKSGLTDIAKILDVSPKKLQRLLSEEGESFSNILGNVRQGMAKRLLFESDIKISHLAVLLDYSSTEAFNAACQRWFGVSPRQYRKDVRAQRI